MHKVWTAPSETLTTIQSTSFMTLQFYSDYQFTTMYQETDYPVELVE